MSTIRIPSSGSPGGEVSRTGGRDQSKDPVCSPGAGTSPRTGGSTPLMRYGHLGWRNPPAGLRTKTPLFTNCGNDVTVAAVPTGATGIRSAVARSITSRVGWSVVQSRTIVFHSPRLARRALAVAKRSSSIRSALSIRVTKSWYCCREFVVKPTQPSRVGSMDGLSTHWSSGAALSGRRPSRLASRSTYDEKLPTAAASRMETSTCSPRPWRRDAITAASPAVAAYPPATKSNTRPPTEKGSRPGRPRPLMQPDSACTTRSDDGRSAHGPLRP